MTPPDMTAPEISIQSVSIRDGVVEIAYAEKRHQKVPGLGKAQIHYLDLEEHPKYKNLVQDIEELLRELIDELELAHRNPPERIHT